jgi:transposase
MERKITLSLKQTKRLKVISMFSEGSITRAQAAERLGLSERQIARIRRRYEQEGDVAAVHKNSGRRPATAVSNETRERVVEIHAEEALRGVNHSHFAEILREEYGIAISRPSVHRILAGAGIKSPKAKKRGRKRFRLRERMAHPGELVQVDATLFEWFGGGEKFSLHGAVDDATGAVVGLYMAKNECMHGYFEVMRQCIEGFGVPQSLYADGHSIFRSPRAGAAAERGEDAPLTQFGRAIGELGTDIIHARTPQAKGRVERLWDTLQGRLPVEFARRGIKDVAAANAFLAGYRAGHNAKFAVEPRGEAMYVAFPTSSRIDDFLCARHARRVDSTSVFSFMGRTFRIDTKGFPLIPKGASVDVLTSPAFGIRAEYGGRVFEAVSCIRPAVPGKAAKAPAKCAKGKADAVKPHLLHSSDEWKRIWWSEGYQDSLDFLYSLFFENVHRKKPKDSAA